jgi:hypothetical protein
MDGTPPLPQVTVAAGVRRTFAAVVQETKDRRGWSARDLARAAHLSSHWTVHNCLTGKDISLSSALKIAVALGLDTGDLGQAGDLR